MAASKPLNPMAAPYQKLPPSFHHHLIITPPFQFLPFSSPYLYNVHLQPSPRKPPPSSAVPPPPPPPLSGKKRSNVLTPVPSGPRIPKGRHYYRRITTKNNNNNFHGARQQLSWRPKNTISVEKNEAKKEVFKKEGFGGFSEGRKRWKNRGGKYKEVLPVEDETTSVMIKNIPNRYTRKLLIQTLDDHCKVENEKKKDFVSGFDFLYLPIDFKHRVNAGFAFVNFTTPKAAMGFRDAFHGKSWDLFDSPKIAEISAAKIQGKDALINHCGIMDFTYGYDEDMPVWFEPARNGSGQVNSKMFTVGKFVHWSKMKYGK
ncbi:hypothetical protein OSB04_008146, partial [Centaurea solstitialis]